MKFQEKKDLICSNAKEAGACISEYKKALNPKNTKQLMRVVVDNLRWCYSTKVVTIEILEKCFGEKALSEEGVYWSDVEITDAKGDIYLLDSSSATIKTWGSSSATIKTWDSSSATYYVLGSRSSLKDLTKRKLFVKKSKFEIIEV